MARETTTVQCYPDDDIINKRIKEYEAFGWELINNQRCQEYDGTTSSSNFDGSTTVTRHFSTFNKLTFSHDKSAAWYSKIVDMEQEYKRLKNTKPSEPYNKKASGVRFFFGAFFVFLFIPFMVWGNTYGTSIPMIIVGVVSLLLGIIVIATGIAKNKKYNQAREAYRVRMLEWEGDTGVKADKIKEEANKIVSQE